MQNRQFNLPSLGSRLTIIPLTQTKWFGFVRVCKMLPTAVLSPRERLGCFLFWKYWLLNLGNQTTKATCCLREVMGCTSETRCSSARDISNVSCIPVCFISCMYPLFLLKKAQESKSWILFASKQFIMVFTLGHRTPLCLHLAKSSTAPQCLVYHWTLGLSHRRGEAAERSERQGRGSFKQNFSLGSLRRISKRKQDLVHWVGVLQRVISQQL